MILSNCHLGRASCKPNIPTIFLLLARTALAMSKFQKYYSIQSIMHNILWPFLLLWHNTIQSTYRRLALEPVIATFLKVPKREVLKANKYTEYANFQ